MNKIKITLLALFVSLSGRLMADEGMWLPLLLEKLNEKEMKSMGMKISAKDIYDINKGSLKDAIVSFGGFCTAEVISKSGLLLTNHHCGFDAIQNHSTLQHNYIRDGFWAANHGQELANPGLTATFIVRIDDITSIVLRDVVPDMDEKERQSSIDKTLAEFRKNYKKESYQDLVIRPFFDGNKYYMFLTETFRDVRLVGAPPSAIGNFGKDTDNWIWPRHTGDFSMFRIYAGKENKPADYSPDNVPYQPKRALSVSLDGVAENDFTMVFGFPGRTTEYLHSAAVEQILTVNDPAKIAIRERALSVMDGFMRKDEQIKIQYAAKYASVQNAYKKWQGEVLGLTKTDGVGKKKAYETEFQKRVNANPAWKQAYGTLLADLEKAYAEIKNYALARDYFTETMSRIEAFSINAQLNALRSAQQKNGETGLKESLPKVIERLGDIYKEYNPKVDQQLFISLMEKFVNDQPQQFVAPYLKNKLAEFGNDVSKFSDDLYKNVDLFQNGVKILLSLNNSPELIMAANEMGHANQLNKELAAFYTAAVAPQLNALQSQINRLNRLYMQAQMEVMKERKFYPDANSTLRVTYGKVKGYAPRDAVKFDFYTYLDGVMAKYIPGDYEFDLPEKLRSLYQAKDYGQYGSAGKMPVCFIAQNHTTGGNSGSPALDAYGNLIGLNFDRVWEGTMSDINYDPSICRNIMVDIRYVLFIVDKFAGATHLVKEMNLVHPKKKK